MVSLIQLCPPCMVIVMGSQAAHGFKYLSSSPIFLRAMKYKISMELPFSTKVPTLYQLFDPNLEMFVFLHEMPNILVESLAFWHDFGGYGHLVFIFGQSSNFGHFSIEALNVAFLAPSFPQFDVGQTRPSNNVVSEATKNDDEEVVDYSQRAQWLRAAVLGANDGLVSVASLMMGIGSVRKDIKAMLLAGFAGLVAGACSMAIGEFVSVYTQYDIEKSQIRRRRQQRRRIGQNDDNDEEEEENNKLPNPAQAAVASALAFSVGAVAPLLAAAFINDHKVRLGVVATVASFALMFFGAVGAVLGRTPVMKSCARVLIGGWLAMAITFGLTKLIGSAGLQI
uniref:Uncharacterized protein n=1 Tax=Cannabis sativa TaxID=3483 RepID=A0A803Q043_CANSA